MTDKPEEFEDEDIQAIDDDEMDQVKGGKGGPSRARGGKAKSKGGAAAISYHADSVMDHCPECPHTGGGGYSSENKTF